MNAAKRVTVFEREPVMRGLLKLVVTTVGMIIGASDLMAAQMRNVDRIPVNFSDLRATSTELGSRLVQALGLDSNASLALTRTLNLPNNAGRTLRFNQLYRGVPVWGQQVVVEQNADGQIRSLSGTVVYDIAPIEQVTPRITPNQALQLVKEAVQKQSPKLADSAFENEEASLVYYLQKSGVLKLTYKVSFFTTVQNDSGGAKPTRPVFFIDAVSGETVDAFENIQFAPKGKGRGGNVKTGQYDYGAGRFPPFEVTEQGAQCNMDSVNVFTENLNHQTNGSNSPYQFNCYTNTFKQINGAYSPLNDAQSFGQVVFDMYKDWYGTSPLRQKLQLRVHYSTNFENAFWNGSSMTFGDGANRFYPLVSMDVTAHEVSHGFTEQNSGLTYQGQSGGMNESFSDMAGEAAEYYYVQKYGAPFTRPMPDLETGADIFKQAGQSLRYLCDPKKDGRSIDDARNYQDGMDVHYTSGVYNKAFCLLSKKSGWTIRTAFDVFVTANQHFWTPNSTFQTGAEGSVKAANTLGYSTSDVVDVFAQVGIFLSQPTPTPTPGGPRYYYTSLRVITDGAPRGCANSNWDCMTSLCRADLQDQNAWRGWAGCWQKSNKYICYFECGQLRNFF